MHGRLPACQRSTAAFLAVESPDRAHARRLGVRLRSAGHGRRRRVRRAARAHRRGAWQGAALSADAAPRPARLNAPVWVGRPRLRRRPARRALDEPLGSATWSTTACPSRCRGTGRCGRSRSPIGSTTGASGSSARPTTAWSTGSPRSSWRRCCSIREPDAATRRHGRLAPAAGARTRGDARRGAQRPAARAQLELATPARRGSRARRGALLELARRGARRWRGRSPDSLRPAPPVSALNEPISPLRHLGAARPAARRPAADQELASASSSTTSCSRRRPARRAALPRSARRGAAAAEDDGPGQRPDRRRGGGARQPDLVHVRRPALRRARSGAAPDGRPRWRPRERKERASREGADGSLRSIAYVPHTVQQHGLAARRQPADVQPRRLEHPGPRSRSTWRLRAGARPTRSCRSPISHALSIGITTIGDGACFGLYADRESLPDADALAGEIDALDRRAAGALRGVERGPLAGFRPLTRSRRR